MSYIERFHAQFSCLPALMLTSFLAVAQTDGGNGEADETAALREEIVVRGNRLVTRQFVDHLPVSAGFTAT